MREDKQFRAVEWSIVYYKKGAQVDRCWSMILNFI
jgi:hypothetical protein